MLVVAESIQRFAIADELQTFPPILCKNLFHVRTKLQTILNYFGMLTKVVDS
jgi:hypothetical protein